MHTENASSTEVAETPRNEGEHEVTTPILLHETVTRWRPTP